MPRPDTRKVQPTKSSRVTAIRAVFFWTPNSRSSTVSMANAPLTALIVSQPQRATQIRAPGKRLPRWPNTARERAMPGAPPRFPAIEIRPTSPYETTGAATATTSTCQMLSLLKITRPAPMVSSSTLMLAATQVGTSSRTRPLRSPSGTGSRPRVSTDVSADVSGGVCIAPSAGSAGMRHSGWAGRTGIRPSS